MDVIVVYSSHWLQLVNLFQLGIMATECQYSTREAHLPVGLTNRLESRMHQRSMGNWIALGLRNIRHRDPCYVTDTYVVHYQSAPHSLSTRCFLPRYLFHILCNIPNYLTLDQRNQELFKVYVKTWTHRSVQSAHTPTCVNWLTLIRTQIQNTVTRRK